MKKEKKLKLNKKDAKQTIKNNKDSTKEEKIKILKQPTKEEFGIAEKQIDNGQPEMVKRSLDNFISTVSKSKIAVIVPLIGYWSDIKDNQLDLDVLKTVVNRIYSQAHELSIIFVADEKRLPKKILNYIGVNSFAGNVMGVSVEKGSCYSEYIEEGMDAAIETIDARFIMVVNPWVMLQEHSIDEMANRLNRSDVMVVSGYNIRNEIKPEMFDEKIFAIPQETKDINMDFVGINRVCAEMAKIDTSIRTKKYTEKDLWQTIYRKGYEVIVSQRIPIYVFDIDMKEIESKMDYQSDKEVFTSKWGFNPGIK
jgi:hypothetical protein